MAVFPYGEGEITHLKKRDKALARAIDHIGPIRREVDPDLFSSLASSIVGQQISGKAADTIWRRMLDDMGQVTPETILARPVETIQAYGMSFRKAGYIRGTAERIAAGEFDLMALPALPDADVCSKLVTLPGIGVWTAEMLMIFSMLRPNILSFGDLGIRRGMERLYRHTEVTREQFEKYRKRYAPYCTVASLYLWAIAGGALDGTGPAEGRSRR